ncbi:MAG: glycoside hydrolase family 127 protein [Acidobacteriota bacterium]
MDTTESTQSSISRRSFLTGIGSAAAIGFAGRSAFGRAGDRRRKLWQFDYSQVKLTGGPLKTQFDRIHAAYLALNNDSLLKVYRERAGLPAPGAPMGGWYGPKGFIPGHSLGQYISGLARFARATGSKPTYDKVRELVDGFAATLGPGGYPYASKQTASTWPCYVLDKFMIGLLDAYWYGGIKQARQLLPRVIHGAEPYLPAHVHDRIGVKHPPYDEPYILPENLFNTCQVTGEKKFFAMARKYLLNKVYFDPLADGTNVLPGRHAYSHVMALSSAAKAYEMLGDPVYLRTLVNTWGMLKRTQEFASGGWGPNEAFVELREGKLGDSLITTHDHFETPCGCYAHFKFARYLLAFTEQARYGDGLERLLYNTVLGAKYPSGTGYFFYYSDYHPLVKKGYYPQKWPCCSGTLVQDVADYLIGIYFHSAEGIYVNLFTPSEVRWNRKGVPVKIVQTTDYPLDGSVELRVEVPAPTEFTVFVRIPGWLESSPRIAVNGKSFEGASERQTFAAIRRKWKQNDTIHVTFPLSARLMPVDAQHSNTVAVMYGPLALVAVDPPEDIFTKPLPLAHGFKLAYSSYVLRA